MFKKRAKVYKETGYEFVTQTKKNSYRSAYYTSSNYVSVLEKDLLKSHDIYIRSFFASKELIEKLNAYANDNRNVILEVDSQHIPSENLISPKITLKIRKLTHNNVIILDHQICWYGDLNFGGKSFPDTSAIRIISSDVARSLVG